MDDIVMPLRPVNSTKRLYQEVVEQLIGLVESGEIRPGGKLPAERVLQEKLQVSRAVLREAFRVLESRGLIYTRPGDGRYVRHVPPDQAASSEAGGLSLVLEKASLLEILEARQYVEPLAAKKAALTATDQDLIDLQNAYRRLLESIQKPLHRQTDMDMHLAIARASGSFVMYEMIKLLIALFTQFDRADFMELIPRHNPEDWMRDHGAILHAIETRNGELAYQVMYQHLERTVQLVRSL